CQGLPSRCPRPASLRSDLQYLGLLVFGDVVDSLDEPVGQLLQPLLRPPLVLLRDTTVLFGLAQVLERVAAAVADGDARLLGALVYLFDQLLAPILRQLGQHQANHLTIVGRIDPEVGLLDRFFDWSEHAAIPGLHQHHARVRRSDVRDAIDRRGRAVVVDLDAIEQRGTGATSADRLQIATEDVHGGWYPWFRATS